MISFCHLKNSVILLLCGLFSTFAVIAGNATLTISATNDVHHQRLSGSSGSLQYQFQLTNNLSKSLLLASKTTTHNLPNLAVDNSASTCVFGGSLAAHSSCILVYTSTIPNVQQDLSKTVLDNLYVVDGLGYQTNSPKFGVTLKPIDGMGHLTFKSESNPNVTDLDLHPGEKGSLTLHNNGGATITNMEFTFSDANGINETFAGYFSGTCADITQLAKDATCTLNYNVPITPAPVDGDYKLSITGNNLSNSPSSLKVNITSDGDFDFFAGDDKLSELDLHTNKQGSITLHNTGGRDIGNVQLAFSAGLSSSYFPNNCVGHPLAKNGQCTINYDIPDNATVGNYTITASDTTGAAADKSLTINIARIGHFVFRDAANDEINNVSTVLGNAGVITLHNTGGEEITNLAFSFLKSGAPDENFRSFFSGTCVGSNVESLPAGSSCELIYDIPPYKLDNGNFNIKVQGDNADNPGQQLTLPFTIRNVLFAVGSGGTVLSSPDGKIWYRSDVPGSFSFLYGVATFQNHVGIVGSGGNTYGAEITMLDDWSKGSVAPGNTTQLNGVAIDRLQNVVIVGNIGLIAIERQGGEGIDIINLPIANDLYGVAFDNSSTPSQIVVVGSTFANKTAIWTSNNDGYSWGPFNNSFNVNLYAVTHGNNQYVAVGSSGAIITLPDGINWTQQTTPVPSVTLRGVVYRNSQYVAVGSSGTVITSPDGVTWTQRTSGVAKNLNGVTFDGSHYIAVGQDGTIISSADGSTWVQETSGTIINLNAITY